MSELWPPNDEKRPCARCKYGVEPSWQVEGYFRKSSVIQSIEIETTGYFATILPEYMSNRLLRMWSGYETPEIERKEIKVELVMCDGCWNDFDKFMKEFTNLAEKRMIKFNEELKKGVIDSENWD